MSPRPLVRAAFLFAMVLLSGCSSGKPTSAEAGPPEVSVRPVVYRDEMDYDNYEGRIDAVNRVDVKMRATGYLLKFGFTEGSEVKEKDLLFEIDPKTYEAQLGIARGHVDAVQAKVKRLTKDFERVRDLLPRGGISREEFDKVSGDLSEAEGSLKSADANLKKAELDLSYCKYNAPFTGRIDRVLVTPGNLIVADNTVLTTLISTDPVYVDFDIDERALLRYQQSRRTDGEKSSGNGSLKNLDIPCEVALDTDEGFPNKGKLDFSASKLDPSTGTYPVRGVLHQKDNNNRVFTPGLRARVRIPVTREYKAVLVPERAVLTDQKQRYVYVVRDESAAENGIKAAVAKRVDVELGENRGDLVIVKSGLTKDDRVIVNNIQRVRPEAKVRFPEEKK